MKLTQFRKSASITIGKRGGLGKVITGLRIYFEVNKTEDKSPNTAHIEVYNLSKDTRNVIHENKEFIILNAGYIDGNGEELLFIGNVLSVDTRFETPNIVTIIECSDGKSALFSDKISVSYSKGVLASSVLSDILSKMSLSNNLKTISIPSKAYANGFAHTGLAKDALTKVTDFLEMKWSVQNNEIRMIPFDGDDRTQSVYLTPKTGLLGSPERIKSSNRQSKGNSLKKNAGWRFTSLLQPRILPTSKFIVSSRDIPEDTQFVAVNVSHHGDTHESEFKTIIEAK